MQFLLDLVFFNGFWGTIILEHLQNRCIMWVFGLNQMKKTVCFVQNFLLLQSEAKRFSPPAMLDTIFLNEISNFDYWQWWIFCYILNSILKRNYTINCWWFEAESALLLNTAMRNFVRKTVNKLNRYDKSIKSN